MWLKYCKGKETYVETVTKMFKEKIVIDSSCDVTTEFNFRICVGLNIILSLGFKMLTYLAYKERM